MSFRSPILFSAILGVVVGFTASATAQDSTARTRLQLLKTEWEKTPDNLKVALVLGGELRRMGKMKEGNLVVENSIAALEKRAESEGDSAELQYLLGTGALFLNRNEAALNSFQFALSLEPEREEIHLGLIRSLLNLGRGAEAADALQLAGVLFPESDAVKNQLSASFETSGNYQEAVPILEELRILKPDDSAVFDRLLRAYIETGNAEKAKPMFVELAERGSISRIEAIVHVFRIHLAQGDLRNARMELQNVSEEDQKNPLFNDAFREYYSLQAREAEEGNNYRRAILYWERALERVPDDFQTQYQLALAHASLNDHEKALELYIPLLEQKPANAGFYADVTLSLLELERYDVAYRMIQLGLKIALSRNDQAVHTRLQDLNSRLTQNFKP